MKKKTDELEKEVLVVKGDPHNGLIVKSNVLVEASYKLGVNEHKVIRFVASKIKKDDEDFKTYTLSVREFAEAVGVKGHAIYEEMEKISYEILRKPLRMKLNGKVTMVPWFSYISYNSGEGTVDIRFDKFFKPHLLNLKSRFTRYNFQNIAKLKSNYAIRLYELLKQYQEIGHRLFELDELREKLCCEDIYPEYANLKQKIIKVAQKEIKKKTDISFTFEEIKKSRKVEKIKFIIQGNHQGEEIQMEFFDHEEPSTPFFNRIKEMAQKQGLYLEDSDIRSWEKYGERAVLNIFMQIQRREDIRDAGAYITKVLSEIQKKTEKADQEESEKKELPKYVINQSKEMKQAIGKVDSLQQKEALQLLLQLGEIDQAEYEQRVEEVEKMKI